MKNNKLSMSNININANMIDQRIDNFLIKNLKKLPRSMIYRIIRIGTVQVNQKKVKPKYKLKLGDLVTIPPFIPNNFLKKKTKIPRKITDMLIKRILYEDNYLLIINKPSGIAVHGGSGLSFGIIEIFRFLRPSDQSLELVHRLDKDTSGILILSKKNSALRILHQQLRENKIKKSYLALVHGRWPNNIKQICSPLLKNHKNLVSINNQGKPSKTYFKIKKLYSTTTLMSIIPVTGRTHQIRVHTLSIGHPIVFDNRYGNSKLDKNLDSNHSKKLLLHANKITFIHPNSEQKISINAILDSHFKYYLSQLI
ncbi:RluA family pseudouridine synthase [Buchnera aphidicola (Hormaphis cornu)]|nr:RluA family pseudouridine synthase [Buchnera aphidicola (Hormaphis cornu)]